MAQHGAEEGGKSRARLDERRRGRRDGAGALKAGEGWACTDLLAFKRTGREPVGSGDRHGRSTSGSGGMGSG
jgi:hypothetical protein